MTTIDILLLLLFFGCGVGEATSRSMMLHIEADKFFSPSDPTALLSQSLVLTSLKCAQLCLVSNGCQLATFDTSQSSCSIYSANVSSGSLLSGSFYTTYLVISVFLPPILGMKSFILFV